MQINKGVQAMLRGRKSYDPDFKISSERVLKLGKQEIRYHLTFWFKVTKQSGEIK
jgi:hypothetical protein